MKRIAILISGRGSNMASLLRALKKGEIKAEASLVLSNRPDAGGLEVARAMGVKTAVVNHKDHADRGSFDAAMQQVLVDAGIDFVCLAGFMRLLTTGFVESWEGRMINIHPSLLPSFKGLHTHQQALDAGAKLHGCTVHYVTPDLDAGPIIAQAAVPVLANDTAQHLAERVLTLEHKLYPAALQAIADGRVIFQDGRAVQIDEAGKTDTGRVDSLYSKI